MTPGQLSTTGEAGIAAWRIPDRPASNEQVAEQVAASRDAALRIIDLNGFDRTKRSVVLPNGDKYVGQCLLQCKRGHSGECAEMCTCEPEPCGYGMVTFANGKTARGDFDMEGQNLRLWNGKMHTKEGVLRMTTDSPHTGTWYDLDGTVLYDGGRTGFEITGLGTAYYPGTTVPKYKGEFYQGNPHGGCTRFGKDGSRMYTGQWKEGRLHGEGIAYGRGRIILFDGEWRAGTPVETCPICQEAVEGAATVLGCAQGDGKKTGCQAPLPAQPAPRPSRSPTLAHPPPLSRFAPGALPRGVPPPSPRRASKALPQLPRRAHRRQAAPLHQL